MIMRPHEDHDHDKRCTSPGGTGGAACHIQLHGWLNRWFKLDTMTNCQPALDVCNQHHLGRHNTVWMSRACSQPVLVLGSKTACSWLGS
jgi:hypothetical protein